jgi:hypothetical protein
VVRGLGARLDFELELARRMNGWISQSVSSCLHWQQGEAFGRHVKMMGKKELLRGWTRKIGVLQCSNSCFPIKFFKKKVSGDLVSFI